MDGWVAVTFHELCPQKKRSKVKIISYFTSHLSHRTLQFVEIECPFFVLRPSDQLMPPPTKSKKIFKINQRKEEERSFLD